MLSTVCKSGAIETGNQSRQRVNKLRIESKRVSAEQKSTKRVSQPMAENESTKWPNSPRARNGTCTSSGRPLASAIVCAKWSEHSGERSECLITTELPAMTAGITELTCVCVCCRCDPERDANVRVSGNRPINRVVNYPHSCIHYVKQIGTVRTAQISG